MWGWGGGGGGGGGGADVDPGNPVWVITFIQTQTNEFKLNFSGH